MFNGILKRSIPILLAVMLFLCCVPRIAYAAEDGGAGDEQAGMRLLDTRVVDLGAVPEETASEMRCDVLIVTDLATGVLLHEKNITARMPVSGSAVYLMMALTALDHVSMDDAVLVTEKLAASFPEAGGRFGLVEGSRVYISDLIASMLLRGDADSAIVLANAAIRQAKVPTIGQLMAEKAQQLGMTETDYAHIDGAGLEPVLTTARDQCALYLAALNSAPLAAILQSGVYTVRSKIDFATPTPEPTPVPKRGKKAAAEPGPNDALPDQIKSPIEVVVPESEAYDVRLSHALGCMATAYQKNYEVVFFRALEYRSDFAVLYWAQVTEETEEKKPKPKAEEEVVEEIDLTTKTCGDLTEIFKRRKIVDLVPYIQAVVNPLTIEKSGVSIGSWSMQADYSLYGRQMVGYDPDMPDRAMGSFDLSRMTVRLQTDSNAMVTNADGSRTIDAIVLINNEIAGSVQLSTAARAGNTNAPTQGTTGLYSEDDVMPVQPTLMTQYGWFILMCAAVLLAMLVIIVGILIRNRMER